MPLFFLPDEAVQNWANYTSGRLSYYVENYYYGAYTSNYTPVSTDTLLTYTVMECVIPLYARATMASTTWAGGIVANQWVAVAPALTITFGAYGGGTTIYGLFLVLEDSGGNFVLGGASLLASPYLVPAVGGFLAFTPTNLVYSA